MSKTKQYRMIVIFPGAAKEKMIEAKTVLQKYGFSVTIQELDVIMEAIPPRSLRRDKIPNFIRKFIIFIVRKLIHDDKEVKEIYGGL